MLVGQFARGLIIGIAINSLWVSGLLIGGVGVVNRANHPAWFIGQALTAPSVVVDYVIRRHLYTDHPQRMSRPGGYEPSFGRVNEQGILYTALAGLLNLLTILDVMYRAPAAQTRGMESPHSVLSRRAESGT